MYMDIPSNIIYLKLLKPETKLDTYQLVNEYTECGIVI